MVTHLNWNTPLLTKALVLLVSTRQSKVYTMSHPMIPKDPIKTKTLPTKKSPNWENPTSQPKAPNGIKSSKSAVKAKNPSRPANKELGICYFCKIYSSEIIKQAKKKTAKILLISPINTLAFYIGSSCETANI